MGSGKSTVGPLLASRLGYRFIDVDNEVEARAGKSVADIFRTEGEAAFRDLEARAIQDLVGSEAVVLATGGGAFAQPRCAEALISAALTVHLHCDLDEARRRVAGRGTRPLLEKGESALKALYAERKDKYAQAHVTIDASHRSPEEVAEEVFRLLTAPSL